MGSAEMELLLLDCHRGDKATEGGGDQETIMEVLPWDSQPFPSVALHSRLCTQRKETFLQKGWPFMHQQLL